MYDKYPDLLEYNVDIISMLKECQIRTVRILALMLEKQKKRNGETLYQYEEELVSEDADYLIHHTGRLSRYCCPVFAK